MSRNILPHQTRNGGFEAKKMHKNSLLFLYLKQFLRVYLVHVKGSNLTVLETWNFLVLWHGYSTGSVRFLCTPQTKNLSFSQENQLTMARLALVLCFSVDVINNRASCDVDICPSGTGWHHQFISHGPQSPDGNGTWLSVITEHGWISTRDLQVEGSIAHYHSFLSFMIHFWLSYQHEFLHRA